MPSFQYPEVKEEKINKTVTVSDPEYSHSIVDTKVQPLNSLITHIEGSSRIVDYYSQVLSSNEETQKYSGNLAAHLQQYREILDFELKQTDFSYSMNDENQEVSVSGTALIYPPLIPNDGDVFITDIGSGQIGLMNVNKVEKKSIFKQACYEVTYSLLSIITDKNEVDVLKQKVVETYYFVKDFILYGQNPLLVESEYLLLQNAHQTLFEAIEDYITEFYSRELTCLVVPGEARPTYDPFAVKAFMEVVEAGSHPRVRKIHTRNTNELKEFWDDSIWNAIINPSSNQYRSMWARASAVSVNAFNIHPRINSIRFSGFDLCVRPLDKLENVDTYYHLNENGDNGFYGWFINKVSPITASGSALANRDSLHGACWCKVQSWYHSHHHRIHPWDPMNHLDHLEDYNHPCHDPDCPCACHLKDKGEGENPIDDSNSYIFSPSFWDDGVTSIDGFEAVVKQHLKLKKVDPAILIQLLLQRRTWTPKQRYYRMLILIIILISAIRSM